MKSLWHTIPKESLFLRLDTSFSGLSDAEVKRLLQKKGLNLPYKNSRSSCWAILPHLLDPLYSILALVALVKLSLHEVAESSFIFFVILFNVLLGFLQEWKS